MRERIHHAPHLEKICRRRCSSCCALALSLLAAPVSADTAAEIVTAPPVATATTQPDDTQHSGWETVDGKRYYYDPETGEMQTGWLVLTNGSISRRYFFGEDGAVMTGFFRTDANTSPVYYADEEGAVVKGGIHTIDGKPYWFYEDGSLHTGWQTVNGKRYFYDPLPARSRSAGSSGTADTITLPKKTANIPACRKWTVSITPLTRKTVQSQKG